MHEQRIRNKNSLAGYRTWDNVHAAHHLSEALHTALVRHTSCTRRPTGFSKGCNEYMPQASIPFETWCLVERTLETIKRALIFHGSVGINLNVECSQVFPKDTFYIFLTTLVTLTHQGHVGWERPSQRQQLELTLCRLQKCAQKS